MDKWISVEDRLPEDGDWVLTFNQEDYRMEVYGWFGDYYGIGFMNDLLTEGFKVTHWMTLPEPPEVNNEV